MAASGSAARPAISIFSPRSVSVITVKRVHSLPVPAVVGMAMTGSTGASFCTGTLNSRIFVPGRCARIAMAFAVSIGEPPPNASRQSCPPPANNFTPASITVSSGSGMVSLNTANAIPAVVSGSVQRRSSPVDTITGSVTMSGRRSPKPASTEATVDTVPPPTWMARGATMLKRVTGGPPILNRQPKLTPNKPPWSRPAGGSLNYRG